MFLNEQGCRSDIRVRYRRLFGAWQAWELRFVQDDAYISWRYADNLARGLGLVWNEGERVEGYTNFLWTVILAIPHRLGLDVEMFAIALGLVLFTVTLAIFYALVGTLTRSWIAPRWPPR